MNKVATKQESAHLKLYERVIYIMRIK